MSQDRSPVPSDSYVPQLDTLRAIAVSLVLLWHGTPERYAFKHWLPWGPVGVRLFFVLSGFLISGILLDCRAAIAQGQLSLAGALRRFYIRRFLRIFPLYYFMIALGLGLGIPAMLMSWRWHIVYASNFYFLQRGDWLGPVSHFWSLAVEEQFYLVWPWLLLLLPRRALLPVLGGLLCLAPLTRLWVVLTQPQPGEVLLMVIPTEALDAFALGSLLALLDRAPRSEKSESRLRWLRRLGLCGGGLLSLLLLLGRHRSPFLLQLFNVLFDLTQSLFFFGLIDWARRKRQGVWARLLSLPPLLLVGRVSYGVYVFHNFIPGLTRRALGQLGAASLWPSQYPTSLLFSAVTTLGFSLLIFYTLESPLNRLKRYFPYRSQRIS